MIPGNTVFDCFINANILIVVAFALWRLARFGLEMIGLKHAYTVQLKLLNTIFLAIIFSPFVILGIQALRQIGVGQSVNVNLSDIVVSYYLKGGFEMRATEFERLLSLRKTFAADVLQAGSWAAVVTLAALATGLVIGTARLVHSVICLNTIVSSSYAWRRFGRVRIRLSDRVLVPFSTRGIWNYYVVIPSTMLGNTDEIKVSLAHEFQHLRQGDIEWEILLELLKPLFFLNPVYHAWKRQVEDLRELAVDSRLLTSGKVDIKSYSDTLLSVCQQSLRRDRVFIVAMPKVTLVTADRFSLRDKKVSFLEERIMRLFDARHLRHPKLAYAAVILPLMAAILLATVAIQSPGDWSQDRLMLSSVVNLERLEEINRLSTLGRVRN
ncbi:MAG: beta-lactamase regulating signal transducer with metallopeptidase domain [Pseudorhodobacter sp.]|jgi:beta-lactamase regulating signal transducer with metallopeptidase domain